MIGTSGLVRGTQSGEGAHTTPDSVAPGKPCPIEFVLELRSTPRRSGALRISWQSLLKLGAKASALVDVDDDAKVEWRGGDTSGGFRTQIVPVAFDAQGRLRARVAIFAEVRGAGPFVAATNYGRLDVRFQDANAGKCTITPYGQGCPGVALAGGAQTAGAQHIVTSKLTGAWPNSFALETIGSAAQNIPLPGGCTLLSNAISILVHPTDAKGEVQVVRKTSTFTRLSTRHQFLPLTLQNNSLVLRASNGLHLVCTGL